MFSQLAKPYRTMNNDLVFIKASQATVMNIARAFAQARLLDLNLAKENTGLLCGAGESADHHGANGTSQKTYLSWRTCRHIYELPQNEVGNQLPKS